MYKEFFDTPLNCILKCICCSSGEHAAAHALIPGLTLHRLSHHRPSVRHHAGKVSCPVCHVHARLSLIMFMSLFLIIFVSFSLLMFMSFVPVSGNVTVFFNKRAFKENKKIKQYFSSSSIFLVFLFPQLFSWSIALSATKQENCYETGTFMKPNQTVPKWLLPTGLPV